MIGPWGTAIGTGIGLVMDIASANDAWADAQNRANAAMRAMDVDALTASLADYKARLADLEDANDVTGIGDFFDDTWSMMPWQDTAAGLPGDLDKKIAETKDGIDELGLSLKGAQDLKAHADKEFAEDQALEELATSVSRTASEFFNLGAAIKKPELSLEQLSKRMAKQAEANENYAANVATAIKNGVDPDAIMKVYDDLGMEGALALEDLAEGGKKAARRFNKDFGRADEAAKDLESTMNGVGQSMLEAGNKSESAGRTMRQVFRRAGKDFDSLPKEVRTKIKADGIPQTMGEINKLVEKYELSEKQREALITLKDLATERIQDVLAVLRRMDGTKTTTYVDVITRRYQANEQTRNLRTPSADGSFVPKTGLPYADRHPYLLADGEGITTNRHGETDRFRDVISGINAGMTRAQVKGMLADGGFAGRPPVSQMRPLAPAQPSYSPSLSVDLEPLRAEIRAVRDEVRANTADRGAQTGKQIKASRYGASAAARSWTRGVS